MADLSPERGAGLERDEQTGRNLTPLLRPGRLALVGASERPSFGNIVLRNLVDHGFPGRLYPVNPKYTSVLRLRCYPDFTALPERVDCAVITAPSEAIPELAAAAAEAGIGGVVVFAGGFGETGPAGRQLEEQLTQFCRMHGLLLCGPNSLGIVNVGAGSVAFGSPLPAPLLRGSVAMIAQSGGVITQTAVRLMRTRGVGFSHLVSIGNQADVSIAEYIHYLLDDPETEVIAVFAEELKDPPRLFAAARKALERQVPIIMMKIGRSAAAGQVALAHTGSVVGDAEVVAAALRQAGIIQVATVNELMETVTLLSCRPVRERYTGGRRVGVLSGSGGACSAVADLTGELGMELPELTDATRQRVKAVLPVYGTARNPLDATGGVYRDDTMFRPLFQALVEDPGPDLILVDITQQSRKALIRQVLTDLAPGLNKPVIVFHSVRGGPYDPEVTLPLRSAGVPFLDGADLTMTACWNLARYHELSRDAAGWPGEAGEHRLRDPEPGGFDLSILPVGVLDLQATCGLLAAFGLPMPVTGLTETAAAPSSGAKGLGFPASGGGLELMLGIQRDPVFGPALFCGVGGVHGQWSGDRVMALPPLLPRQVEGLIRQLRCWPSLAGEMGGLRADIGALCAAFAGLSRLVMAVGDRLEDLEINPLLVYHGGKGVLAAGARVQVR